MLRSSVSNAAARPNRDDINKFVDDWVNYEADSVERDPESRLISENDCEFDEAQIVECLYRPFRSASST